MNLFQEIFAGLRRNKLRTALTGLSVSWGIFILIVLLGAGNGLQNGVMSNFSNRATNTVQLWAGRTSLPHKGLKSGRSLSFAETQLEAINHNLEETNDQTGIINKNIIITYKNEYGNFSVIGANPVYQKIFNLKFEQDGGRFINEFDIKNSNKIIVLDRKIATLLFKNQNPIGQYVKVGNVMFQVVGINSKKERWGDGSAYIPFSTAQRIFNPSRKFYSIAMTMNELKTEAANDAFNDKMQQTMAQSLQFSPDDSQALWIRNSQRDYIETMKIFNGISMFVTIIGLFTLIAGIVGVSNIMLVSVKERTREIGIRKAIGAPPHTILISIVVESIMITAIFGYIGMIAGIGITEIVNAMMERGAAAGGDGMSVFKNPTVQLSYVFTATAILIIAGVVAGYLPARRAVKVKPIEAMREEN
ncbi:MAG: ABC transporter permease [Paludibacter sp.]|nr:ABC transporter permease [Paludibacter sp.]